MFIISLLVQFSYSVVSDLLLFFSDSLWPHGLQHSRLPCPSLSPGLCWDSCPLSQWCYLTILCSAARFSWLQSFQQQGLFQCVSICISWPKYWSFNFSISPSNEYSGLISFRIYWFDLLVVQGILNSLLQNHSLKASILQPPAFFMV